MSDSPETAVRKFFAAFPASDVDELVSFFSDDAVYVDGPRGVHRGVDAIRTEFGVQVQMVPSTTVDIKSLVADGATVAFGGPGPVDGLDRGGSGIGTHASNVRMELRRARPRGDQHAGAYVLLRHGRERSEEHTSELQSHGLISYAVFCLKKKTKQQNGKHPS